MVGIRPNLVSLSYGWEVHLSFPHNLGLGDHIEHPIVDDALRGKVASAACAKEYEEGPHDLDGEPFRSYDVRHAVEGRGQAHVSTRHLDPLPFISFDLFKPRKKRLGMNRKVNFTLV